MVKTDVPCVEIEKPSNIASDAHRMRFLGALSAASYGSDINGVSDARLHAMKSTYLIARGHHGGKSALNKALLLTVCPTG